MQKLEVSERKACSVLGLNRTTKRYKSKKSDDETVLREAIVRLASKYGRYGYRRIAAMLKSEGWKVNHKRVERIWREEGLRVPKKQKKRGRIYLKNGSCIRLKPLYQNHVWSYDCVEDRLANGRKIKCLTVIDEFTRESLAIRVEMTINSKHVLDTISELFLTRGIPEYIRSDNGSEFTEKMLRKFIEDVGAKTAYITPGSPWENGFIEDVGAKTAYITPGSPWENGFIERFNGTLRDELLNREVFYSLEEARALIENFRREYNSVRPHSSLGYTAPLSFISSFESLNTSFQLVQSLGA